MRVPRWLEACARFLLTEDEARRIVDDMEQIVRSRWYQVARREGVSERECAAISSAFVYEGFRLG